ncbi:hypothetical protein D3C84_1073000 [compost metagenome]
MLLLQAMLKLGETTIAVSEEIVHRHLQTLLSVLQLAQEFQLVPADDFSGSRWCWCAHIGNKIGDGDVGFMSDCADDRDLTVENRPRYAFVVKAPQVFQRTAAAPDD